MEKKEEVYDVAKGAIAQRQQVWKDEVKALVPSLRRQGVTEAAITDLVETVDKMPEGEKQRAEMNKNGCEINPTFLQRGIPRQPSMDKPRSEYTFTSGAESGRKANDYGLCPTEAILAMIARFQYGIDKHGEGWRNNWMLGKNDPQFIRDRVNHTQEHLQAVITGYHVALKRPASFEDVQAVLCGVAMVTWWYTHGEGLCNAFPHLTSEGPHQPLSEVKR